MKKAFVIMAVALLCASQAIAQRETEGSSMVTKNIATRASVRSFINKPVKIDQVIEPILRSAMAAPSAMNKQPWEFIVITDRAMLKKLGAEFKNAGFAAQSQFTIIVCGNLKEAIEGEAAEFWVQDCSAATENMLLAIHSMGLGATWCGVYPSQERVEHLRDFLQLPEHIVPLNIVPVGIPEKAAEPKDKWNPNKIHWGKYGNTDATTIKKDRKSIETKTTTPKIQPKKK